MRYRTTRKPRGIAAIKIVTIPNNGKRNQGMRVNDAEAVWSVWSVVLSGYTDPTTMAIAATKAVFLMSVNQALMVPCSRAGRQKLKECLPLSPVYRIPVHSVVGGFEKTGRLPASRT